MSYIDIEQIPTFYHNYIKLVSDKDLNEMLEFHKTDFTNFLKNVPEDKWSYRYAEGKWSIKEVVQHIIDAERIFCFRALTFARKDEKALPGFNEQKYAANSNADSRTKDDLLEELELVQRSSAKLFNSISPDNMDNKGVMNNNPVYVKGIAYILVGHCQHHKQIIEERYL